MHKCLNSGLQSRVCSPTGSRRNTLPDLRFLVVGPHLSPWGRATGGRLSAFGEASETPPPGGRTPPVRGGSRGFCKKSPPRPAPGLEAFVCRSTPGNHPARWLPAGETRGGARGGSGAGSGPSLGLSFSVGGMGRERRQHRWAPIHRDGAALDLSHVEISREREGDRSPLWEWEGVLDRRSDPSPNPAGCEFPQSAPSGLSLHLRTLGALALFRCLRQGLVAGDGRGPEGIWRWSLAGPRVVFGLEVWSGSCGYGEVGLLCPGICVRFTHPATARAP